MPPMNLNFYYAFNKMSNVMHTWTLIFLKVPKPKKIKQARPHEFIFGTHPKTKVGCLCKNDIGMQHDTSYLTSKYESFF